MLHQLIKEATQTLHSDLEKQMYVNEIMSCQLQYEQYRQILVVNYLIIAEYESPLLKSLDSAISLRLDFHKRIKLDALVRDLADVKIDAQSLKVETAVPLNKSHALGCLYVLEGATLGGNIIVKKLQDNIHLKPFKLNYYYYHIYGEELFAYWRQFLNVLNEQPEETHTDIIEGAKYMYRKFMSLNAASRNLDI